MDYRDSLILSAEYFCKVQKCTAEPFFLNVKQNLKITFNPSQRGFQKSFHMNLMIKLNFEKYPIQIWKIKIMIKNGSCIFLPPLVYFNITLENWEKLRVFHPINRSQWIFMWSKNIEINDYGLLRISVTKA